MLQRINHFVFKNPEKLMDNINRVLIHIRKRIVDDGGNPMREVLTIIPARDGECFYKSPGGNYWRAYIYLEDATTYQIVEKPEHLYSAGLAFGRFQHLLSDFPANELYETIPDFHNTIKRFEKFERVLEEDKFNRAENAAAEIEFVLERKEDASRLINLCNAGELPIRVTHNDTKFNNVMIDIKTGKAMCVIDLDTVMPGLSLYDFGDAIRSGTNPASEDEKDLNKVKMDLGLYEQFTRGFLEAGASFLTPQEIENMPFAAKIMTFEVGMRFLTDYLEGDVYFKTHREGHNLDRARTQFKMVSDIENKMEKMLDIIQDIIPENI
jgi:Ser/Thr protein kinase RdoA (MazF antagonist)